MKKLLILTVLVLTGVLTASAQTNTEILQRIISQEQKLTRSLASYSPLVETYIQNIEADPDLGSRPKSDRYFLGKLDMSKGPRRTPFFGERGFAQGLRDRIEMTYSVVYIPDGFAQMIVIDDAGRFDLTHYNFELARREFLGAVRCLVFNVTPKDKKIPGEFIGRIWVEDQDYHIVRFNGAREDAGPSKLYFHFDSWREEMRPGLWLPTYVYTEEGDPMLTPTGKIQFKAQTRLWGYSASRANSQTEFTSLTVDDEKTADHSDVAENISPVMSLRQWEREAADNILDKIQRAGLLAPPGEVDKVLETVINNLEVTNNLNIEPEVHARVMLTSPLDSFTVGHTIVLSRGLIDVLPDEASLAMVISRQLAHIALGHRLATKYAFTDRVLFDDAETFYNLYLKRDENEEKQADQKAMEILRKSPYKDKLSNVGLFLRVLSDRSKRLPNLMGNTLGNRMATNGQVRMSELMQVAPTLQPGKIDQIAALPLGGRIRVNSWDNTIQLMKGNATNLLSAREKMQFEIAPMHLYLTRKSAETPAGTASRNN